MRPLLAHQYGFCYPQQQQQLLQTRRGMSWLPEVVQNISIWGGSGFLLKTLSANGTGILPYWASFAAISVLVRTSLLPVVLYGAHTSSRFAKVVPEVQFLLTLFQNDWKKLRQDKAPLVERLALMRTNLTTLSGLYKLHKIHPLAVFLSPLMQLPIFWYISIDLRKIVNGLDPQLAQQLVESSVAWVPDLTEPDPWFGLPVLAGLTLYANVEVAVGKRSLSGSTAGKSDTAVLLKDVFQSFAVLMPCFTAQLPAGVQIYLVTSFCFTAVQSVALRTEVVRHAVGLPSLLAPPPEATYAKEYVRLKELEQEAKKLRAESNDPTVWGKGSVLAGDWEVSFPGRYRASTIQGSGQQHHHPPPVVQQPSATVTPQKPALSVQLPEGPFVPGISAPLWQLQEQQEQAAREERAAAAATSSPEREFMPQHSDEVMEKANRGEMPRATTRIASPAVPTTAPTKLSLKRFQKSNKNTQRGSSKPKGRRKK